MARLRKSLGIFVYIAVGLIAVMMLQINVQYTEDPIYGTTYITGKYAASIGYYGGIIYTADGNVILDIPRGALKKDIRKFFTIALVPGIVPNVQTDRGSGTIIAQYFIGPSEVVFEQPVKVTIRYDENLVKNEDNLDIFYWDKTKRMWVARGATINKTANTLSLWTSHFSNFSIIETEVPLQLPRLIENVSRLSLYAWNEETGEWEQQLAELNTETKTINLTLYDFSKFVLAEKLWDISEFDTSPPVVAASIVGGKLQVSAIDVPERILQKIFARNVSNFTISDESYFQELWIPRGAEIVGGIFNITNATGEGINYTLSYNFTDRPFVIDIKMNMSEQVAVRNFVDITQALKDGLVNCVKGAFCVFKLNITKIGEGNATISNLSIDYNYSSGLKVSEPMSGMVTTFAGSYFEENLSVYLLKMPVHAKVLSAKITFAGVNETGIYPRNVSLKIGDIKVWNYSNEFNTSYTLTEAEFVSAMNNYLETCVPDGLQNCIILLKFEHNGSRINATAVGISYEMQRPFLTRSAKLFADGTSEKVLTFTPQSPNQTVYIEVPKHGTLDDILLNISYVKEWPDAKLGIDLLADNIIDWTDTTAVFTNVDTSKFFKECPIHRFTAEGPTCLVPILINASFPPFKKIVPNENVSFMLRMDEGAGDTTHDESWNAIPINISRKANWSTDCPSGACLNFTQPAYETKFDPILIPNREFMLEFWTKPNAYNTPLLKFYANTGPTRPGLPAYLLRVNVGLNEAGYLNVTLDYSSAVAGVCFSFVNSLISPNNISLTDWTHISIGHEMYGPPYSDLRLLINGKEVTNSRILPRAIDCGYLWGAFAQRRLSINLFNANFDEVIMHNYPLFPSYDAYAKIIARVSQQHRFTNVPWRWKGAEVRLRRAAEPGVLRFDWLSAPAGARGGERALTFLQGSIYPSLAYEDRGEVIVYDVAGNVGSAVFYYPTPPPPPEVPIPRIELTAPSVCAGADATVTATRLGTGEKISGVSITVRYGELAVATGSTDGGTFTFVPKWPGAYTIEGAKERFDSASMTFVALDCIPLAVSLKEMLRCDAVCKLFVSGNTTRLTEVPIDLSKYAALLKVIEIRDATGTVVSYSVIDIGKYLIPLLNTSDYTIESTTDVVTTTIYDEANRIAYINITSPVGFTIPTSSFLLPDVNLPVKKVWVVVNGVRSEITKFEIVGRELRILEPIEIRARA